MLPCKWINLHSRGESYSYAGANVPKSSQNTNCSVNFFFVCFVKLIQFQFRFLPWKSATCCAKFQPTHRSIEINLINLLDKERAKIQEPILNGRDPSSNRETNRFEPKQPKISTQMDPNVTQQRNRNNAATKS